MATHFAQVAIVDDDVSVRRALALLLTSYSFKTVTYGSAAEFLLSLERGAPTCLIVDLQMPDMTGLELQQRLVRDGVRIPTVVITAHNEFGARERCEAAGAMAFLLKPIQENVLVETINSVTQVCVHKGASRSEKQ
jgi:FixJ family two-component response regulator